MCGLVFPKTVLHWFIIFFKCEPKDALFWCVLTCFRVCFGLLDFLFGIWGVGFEVWVFSDYKKIGTTSRWSTVILLPSPQNKKWLFWVSISFRKVCAISGRLGTCMKEDSCQGLDQSRGLVRDRGLGRKRNHQADLRDYKASSTFPLRATFTFFLLLSRSWNNYLKNKENCSSHKA